MKEKLIADIQAKMADILNAAQMDELQKVLALCIDEAEQKSFDEQKRDTNRELLDAFLSAKQIEGCSPKTLQYYDTTLRRALESIQKTLREITTDDIRLYLTEYQEKSGASKVTIDNLRRIFSSFFNWLEDEGHILKNPVRRIRKIKTEKTVKGTFSDEELEALRDACKEIRDLAMIDLLTSTGMRVGELVQLNRADINFHERECVVSGKGNSERVVYFDARTKIHLLNYLDSRTDTNPALFVSLASPHGRLKTGGIEARLHEIGRRADMQRVHPHKFRRTLATQAIDKGMPIEQVQRLLGHVRIDTTMHYAMVNQANVKNSHRKYIS